jgi:hypothetical protein
MSRHDINPANDTSAGFPRRLATQMQRAAKVCELTINATTLCHRVRLGLLVVRVRKWRMHGGPPINFDPSGGRATSGREDRHDCSTQSTAADCFGTEYRFIVAA